MIARNRRGVVGTLVADGFVNGQVLMRRLRSLGPFRFEEVAREAQFEVVDDVVRKTIASRFRYQRMELEIDARARDEVVDFERRFGFLDQRRELLQMNGAPPMRSERGGFRLEDHAAFETLR